MIAYKEARSILNNPVEKCEKMYGSVYYSPWQYQQELKKRGDALCEKYEIKTSIR
jgi:hypothetical protein